jgi:uncharacterized protein YcsI (UPF0317 family)
MLSRSHEQHPGDPAGPGAGASSAAALRREIRSGRFTGPTTGAAPGFMQANLVALPAAHASAFEAFGRANPQACPIVDITSVGSPHPAIAIDADLRSDLPRYQVLRDGEVVDQPSDVAELWGEDMVAFLIGCSFTFEHALLEAGIPLRHVAEGRNVAMYRTTVPCSPVGPFRAEMVVSMRPIARRLVEAARAITAAMPDAHGAPVSVGEPERLGVTDLGAPDFGDPVAIQDNEVPVFWACGVTAIEAVRAASLPLVITHAPGYMFVSDRRIESPAAGIREVSA